MSGATIRRKAGGIHKGHRIYERGITEEDIEDGVPAQTKTLYAVEPLTDKDKRHADERPPDPDAPPPHLSARLFECDALRMRIQGFSYQQIAIRLDMSLQAVRSAVKRSTQRVEKDSLERAKELIELDLQRLDAMQASLWDVAVAGDIRAQKQIIEIMRHRAKILGITAPKNFNQWNVQINTSSVDETIADTPHGMMSPQQIRTYEDPAEAAKLERELIKLQIDQVEYRERSGELVDKRTAGSTLHRIARLVRDRLMKFPTRMANKLVGMDAPGIARVLDEEVRDVLGEMVDDIQRTMVVEFDDEEDDTVVDAEFVEAPL